MLLALLGIAALMLVVWLYVRNRGQKEELQEPASLTDAGRPAFHAVSIKFDTHACDAAKEMDGRRFLSNAAPRLPLPDCNSLDCRCRFAHHKDRRTRKDRRSPFAAGGFGGGTGSFKMERRERQDRRKDADLDGF